MSGDQTENHFTELAPIYSLPDWWRLLLYGKHPHGDVWFPASVSRGNAIARKLFQLKNNSKNSMILRIKKILGEFRRNFFQKAMKTT
jgi:hypothetical protein